MFPAHAPLPHGIARRRSVSSGQPDRAFELRQEGEVGGELCLAGAMRPGDAELARDGDRTRATEIGSQLEAALTAADQVEIDLGQELGVEPGAVLGALRIVDGEAAAQRVEAGLRAGEFL